MRAARGPLGGALVFLCLSGSGAAPAHRAVASTAASSVLESFLPKEDIERFIVDHFDLGTIRSSFGPRRGPGQRTFKDLGETSPVIGKGTIEFKSDGWFRGIRILGRGDYNKDGIEDLAVCFVDRALKGSYSSQQPLLLTRYGPNERLIAISYQIEDKSCPDAK
jgi:hypothetical protein